MKKIDQKKNNNNKNDTKDYYSKLEYIKINYKSYLEGFEDDLINQIFTDLVNSSYLDNEENNGRELNKFFNYIIPENQENDILKDNFALSKRIKENTKQNKIEIKEKHIEYMTQIMNKDFNLDFILTRELSEQLSTVLSIIYKKIKKKKKFIKQEDLVKYIIDHSQNINRILEKYRNKKGGPYQQYNYVESPSKIYNEDSDALNYSNNNKLFSDHKISLTDSRISGIGNNNKTDLAKSVFSDYYNNDDYKYIFKELKTRKPLNIPLEVLILREKFENIKKIKFILKTNNNNDLRLDSNDLINNIFILFNLNWLFPKLIQVELDLTNENILKEEILSSNEMLDKFLKKVKKNKNSTYYQTEYKNRVFDVHKKSVFNEQNKNNEIEEFELLSDSLSTLKDNNKDEEIKKQTKFLKKYAHSLEMIIIYWYFISKMEDIKTCNFIIPLNFEDQIIQMLKERKIFIFDFNILSNLSSNSIIEVTLDFNSLDNKLFQQVLNFLIKNNKMKKCHLSFFPSEEYFSPQYLFNLLLTFNNSNKSAYVNAIHTNEEIDIFLLRKLSESFGINIEKFFSFFINNPNLKELSLIFDIPSVLNKIDYYEIIIIKLIINMLIYLNNSISSSRFSLNSFSVIAENLLFDNRKHPFLNHFFSNLSIYKKKSLIIQKMTFKLKMAGLTNIYKIIPYHVNYLALGSFDYETFECFVEYITSAEFNLHSEIKNLEISLGNSIMSIKKVLNLLLKLLVQFPKNLENISIYTSLTVNYLHIKNLLEKTNYNGIEKIFIQFNKKSLEDKEFKKIYGNNFQKLVNYKDSNFMNLFFIKNNEIIKDRILRMMYKVGNKYNKKFMDYHIFLEIKKFVMNKGKKQIIIQYK